MPAEIIWLDEAKDDVREILEYIAIENPHAANRYVSGLAEACQKLADFPLSGRRYDEGFRCLVLRNHLIFYDFDDVSDRVHIAAVIDGRRDVEKLLNDKD